MESLSSLREHKPITTPGTGGRPNRADQALGEVADRFVPSDPPTAQAATLSRGAAALLDGSLLKLSPLWTFETGNKVTSSPCQGPDGTVYFGSMDNTLYAVKDGKKLWRYKTGGWISDRPCLGPDGTVYIGSKDRKLNAFRHPESALTRAVEEAGKKSADIRPEVNEDEQWLIIDRVKLEKQKERRPRTPTPCS